VIYDVCIVDIVWSSWVRRIFLKSLIICIGIICFVVVECVIVDD